MAGSSERKVVASALHTTMLVAVLYTSLFLEGTHSQGVQPTVQSGSTTTTGLVPLNPGSTTAPFFNGSLSGNITSGSNITFSNNATSVNVTAGNATSPVATGNGTTTPLPGVNGTTLSSGNGTLLPVAAGNTTGNTTSGNVTVSNNATAGNVTAGNVTSPVATGNGTTTALPSVNGTTTPGINGTLLPVAAGNRTLNVTSPNNVTAFPSLNLTSSLSPNASTLIGLLTSPSPGGINSSQTGIVPPLPVSGSVSPQTGSVQPLSGSVSPQSSSVSPLTSPVPSGAGSIPPQTSTISGQSGATSTQSTAGSIITNPAGSSQTPISTIIPVGNHAPRIQFSLLSGLALTLLALATLV